MRILLQKNGCTKIALSQRANNADGNVKCDLIRAPELDCSQFCAGVAIADLWKDDDFPLNSQHIVRRINLANFGQELVEVMIERTDLGFRQLSFKC